MTGRISRVALAATLTVTLVFSCRWHTPSCAADT